jgi:protein tyrosine phosphatase (PTP) superfamily phosphohydrolase (DUF442 family)
MPLVRQIKLKTLFRGLLIVSLPLVIGLAAFVIYAVANHNLHTVSPGLVYRSGQMDAAALNRIITERGIKTIINLRGSSTNNDWYQVETNTATQLGTRHYDFSLSASREVSDAEMEQILAVMQTAPKPVLIHCKNGADRSGLVGALYLYSLEGKSASAADRQLTAFYGHIPHLFWRDTIAMDRSFWRYVSNHVQQTNLDATKPAHPLSKN